MMKLRALVLVAATAASVAHPANAHASAPSSIVIDGAGFGHGRGLSQWGARALGERGMRWDRIVSHYYPGTALRSVSARTPIRVLVARRTTAVITSTSGFTLTVDGITRSVRAVRVSRHGKEIRTELGAGPSGPWRSGATGSSI